MAAIDDAVCGKCGHSLDGMRMKIKAFGILAIVAGGAVILLNVLDIISFF
jgi:hypothetical protein